MRRQCYWNCSISCIGTSSANTGCGSAAFSQVTWTPPNNNHRRVWILFVPNMANGCFNSAVYMQMANWPSVKNTSICMQAFPLYKVKFGIQVLGEYTIYLNKIIMWKWASILSEVINIVVKGELYDLLVVYRRYVLFLLQQRLAQEFLTTFKEHPNAWTRVDTILEYSQNQQTKYYALQILENVIKTRWKVLPRPQCEGS